jgi:nickel-dependent lactate racemase
MQIMMHYGKTGLPLNLPDEWDITVIRKKPMPVLQDPSAALEEALARPAGAQSLGKLSTRRGRVCILICDITRPVPNGLILPILIRKLLELGFDAASISVLVATGLHRPNEGEELREVVGSDWVMKTVKVESHFARNDGDHILLGKTDRGTPAKIDRRFVEAEVRIAVGLVEPHFMAGYSGGRKVITPGVAHSDTIRSIHAARLLEDQGVGNCIIEGNPLHQELMEIAAMVGECLAINVVIDERRRISFLNFGDLEKSHLEAIVFVRPFTEVLIPHRFKTVITSAAGYPLDKNYYQTVKGMVAALDVLEPGGNLFIASECSEGIGSTEYGLCQKRLVERGPDEFMREILLKRRADIDEWETEMLLKAARVGKIHLYSRRLCAYDRNLTGVRNVRSLDDAIRKSIAETGDNRVAVIPEGPYVIPQCR